MKLIDIHTHVFPPTLAAQALPDMARRSGLSPVGDGTVEGLLKAMPEGGRAALAPVATRAGQSASINVWTAQAAREHPQLTAFGALHPHDAEPFKILSELKAQGIKGVKLHPDYQGVNVDDPLMNRIWAALRELDMLALLHCGLDLGYPPPYKARPEQLASVIGRFPGLKLILAHMGGYCMWHGVERHLAGLPVWLDMSFVRRAMPKEQCTALIRRHGASRVLFGSDWPWGSIEGHIEYLQSLGLSREEEEMILFENAAELLKN